jgi:parallel beta-helix repeat protein
MYQVMMSLGVLILLVTPLSLGLSALSDVGKPMLVRGADIVYVDDDFNESTPGWGIDHFNKIMDGINEVKVPGIVYVFSGRYNETVYVDKSIDLVGENQETTLLIGPNFGAAVYLNAEGINMSGFTVMYSGACSAGAGIKIHAQNVTVSNNTITLHNHTGISIDDCKFNTVIHNTISSNLIGIFLGFSTNNTIAENMIVDNEDGILLRFCSNNNTIAENVIRGNIRGFVINESDPYTFCNNSRLYHNNFINNGGHAFDSNYNIWDDGYPSGGNYWDNYGGVDVFSGPNQDQPGSDGIGDTPYDLPCEHAIDHYPFMYPYGTEFTELGIEMTGNIGVHVTVENMGTIDAIEVQSSILVTGGFLGRINLSAQDNRSILIPDQQYTTDLRPFGLGPVTITVTAEAMNAEPMIITTRGFIVFVFVFLPIPPI